MHEKDASMAIDKPLTECDDPINTLFAIINKLVDLESRMDSQSSAIEEIQDSLRGIIDLLERSKT